MAPLEQPKARLAVAPASFVAHLRGWRFGISSTILLLAFLALLIFFLRPAGESPTIRSLAVLPLENLTGDPGQAHVAAGMTEALITGLARQEGLRVVSRASVRRFEETRPSLNKIARQLGVDILVEGSVQRSGDQLRISARLIDVDGDDHLWAQSFDGDWREVLALQERTVAAMTRAIDSNAKIRLSKRPVMPVAPEAHESYLRARYLLAQPPSRLRLTEAITELEKAIIEEEGFALSPQSGSSSTPSTWIRTTSWPAMASAGCSP